MYYYVEDKQFLRRAQRDSSSMLTELVEELRRNGMNSQFFLVGSGGRNMVTQNENGPFDFDYNLNILSCPNWNDARGIKEAVRKCFNKVMKNSGLSDIEDSTSSLSTGTICFRDTPNKKFSIDLCIVTQNNNVEWERLIHEKTGYTYCDRYYWNIAPNSNKYKAKTKAIKEVPGLWDVVRGQYLKIKNHYLTHNDYNHPSFIWYIEAVNNVYNHLRQRKIIE